jgi:hypothetical protein
VLARRELVLQADRLLCCTSSATQQLYILRYTTSKALEHTFKAIHSFLD